MVYKWKEGSRYSANAEIVAHELEEIGEFVTPDSIIEKAKNRKTELHKCFEWDDTKAAYEFRKEQARGIMQSIITIPDEKDKTQYIARVYENVSIGDSRAYVKTEKILRNEEWKNEVFTQIREGIEQLEMKAAAYEHMSMTLVKVKSRLRSARELVAV